MSAEVSYEFYNQSIQSIQSMKQEQEEEANLNKPNNSQKGKISQQIQEEAFFKQKNLLLIQNNNNDILCEGVNKQKLLIVDERYAQEIEKFLELEYSMENFTDLLNYIHDIQILNQHHGIIGIRKIFSLVKKPSIIQKDFEDLVSQLIVYSKHQNYPQLQLQATWILAIVASGGTTMQCQFIVDKGVIGLLVELFQSNNLSVVDKAISGIINISRNNVSYRDRIIKEGGLINLANAGNKIIGDTLINHCYRAMSILCRGKTLPKYDEIKSAIYVLCLAIATDKITNKQVLTDCCQAISDHTEASQTIIYSGVVAKIIGNLEKYPINQVIRIFENVSVGNQKHIANLLSERLLQPLEILLNHQNPGVRKKVCQVVSKIAGGNKFKVQALLARESMMNRLLYMFENEQNDLKIQICSIFSNMSISGDPQKILKFYKQNNIVQYYLNILSAQYQQSIRMVLRCLIVILARGQKVSINTQWSKYKEILQYILEDQNFSCENTKQKEQKFKDKIISENICINNLLQKKRNIQLLGTASTQICFFDQIREKYNHYFENWFNQHSKLDREVWSDILNCLKKKDIYKDKQIICQGFADVIHLAQDHVPYHLFCSAQRYFGKDERIELKDYLDQNDIKLGEMMDCYLLSAMIVLASKYPKMIFCLFVLVKNPCHIYAVRLFIEGKWQTVTLDLQFPISLHRQLVCAQPNDKKIWPMLLQKAYAKVNGSYNRIYFGIAQQGMEVLTGAPSVYFSTKDKDLQKIIERQCQLGSILTASSNIKSRNRQQKWQQIKSLGLVGDQSYSILGVFPNIKGFDNQLYTLIKIRNPSGNQCGVWKGKWNIQDKIWTKQSRTQLGYNLDPKDGTFFMCFKDFQRYYTLVNICRVYQNNTNSWLDLKCQNGKFLALGIKIHEKGNYAFTLYLERRRSYPRTVKIFMQICTWLFLLRKQGSKFIQVCSKCLQYDNNTLQSDEQLQIGEYVIFVKAKWNETLKYSYRLASYGPKQVWMQPELFKESYLNDFFKSSHKTKTAKRRFLYKKRPNIFLKIKFQPELGYGFFQIENQQTSTIKIQVDYEIVNQPYSTLFNPFKFPFTFSVDPGQIFNCKFIIQPTFDQQRLNFIIIKDKASKTNPGNQNINKEQKFNIKTHEDSLVVAKQILNNHVSYFKSNQDSYTIIKLILNLFSKENELINQDMIQNSLKNLKFNNNEEQRQFVKDSVYGNGQIIVKQIQIIQQPEQKERLGKSQLQISYINRIQGHIDLLKVYFNDESKLDKDFAKTASSHLNNQQPYKQKKNMSYKSAKESINLKQYDEDYTLFVHIKRLKDSFSKKMELKRCLRSKDIIQGQIEDCYFLSAISALTNRQPKMIFRLFVLVKNPSHIYGVRLFIEGKWQTQTLDLQFPINKMRDFCGARPYDHNIWPMLLQKAYAQAYGSYTNIQFGTDEEGISILTGAPSICYQTKKQDILQLIERQNKRESILTASLIVDLSAEYLEGIGLVPNHSYSILNVLPGIKGNKNEMVTLIKLRNPWGQNNKTWNGRWSIYSPEWSQQLRQKQKYKLNPKDGSFFMCHEDFQTYFKYINICRIQQYYTNSWLELSLIKNQFMAVRIKISQKGKYCFTSYLKNRRSTKSQNMYRCCWLFLLKKQGQKYTPVCCKSMRQYNNTLQSEEDLQGEYILLVKVINTVIANSTKQQYRLSSYGPKQVWMQTETYNQSYLDNYIQSDKSQPQWEYLDQSQSKNIFKRVKFYHDFGYGLIQIKNLSQSCFHVGISFGQFQQNKTKHQQQKYVEVLFHKKFPLHLQIPANEIVTCKLIILPIFNQRQIKYVLTKK